MFLSFNNGKNIDLSMLREGIEIKDDNFFKKYDKNNNSIFEAEEIAQIQEDLTKAAGEDAVLSEDEAISFYAKIMNKTVEQVQKILKKENNNNSYSAIEQLFTDQAENDAKAKMQSDVDKAIEIYNQAQGGVITKGCNSLKELFNTQYAGDKVYRQIMNKQVSTWLLEASDTENGLTKKEYVERKVELLVSLLGGDTLSEEDKNTIRNGLLKSTEAELEEFLNKLVNAENEDFQSVVKQSLSELDKKSKTLNNNEGSFKNVNPNSLEAILNGKEGEKKLDFGTVYQLENGVEFNEEKILDAKSKAQIASLSLSMYTKIEGLRENLKKSTIEANLALSQPSTPESVKEQKYNQLSDTILSTLKEFLGNDDVKLAEAVKTYSNGLAEIKDGKIVFETKLTGKAGNSAELLAKLAQDIDNALFESLNNFLDGKLIEEYLAEAEESNTKAYGNKSPIDIAEKFQESQYKMLGGVKFAVMGTAGLVGAMSSGLLVPVLSGIVGSGLSVGISALDAATDEKGYTKEDREAIKQELKMNAIYLPTGMAIGVASSAIVGNLTKCTGFLRLLAEAGPDAAMSLLADLAITGEINLKGEGLAQIMNIAMGIVAGSKIHKAGSKIPDTKIEQDTGSTVRTNTENTAPGNKTQKIPDGYESPAVKEIAIEMTEDVCFGFKKGRKNKISQNHYNLTGAHNRSLDSVLELTHLVCQKYGYDEVYVRNNYLKDLDINLNIFKDEFSLKQHIDECIRLSNLADEWGDYAFVNKYYNRNTERIHSNANTEIIRKLSALRNSSESMRVQVDRLIYLKQQNNIDEFSLLKIADDLINGHISPDTVDLALSRYCLKNGHLKVEDLIDSTRPDKEVKQARKNVVKDLMRFNPEMKETLKAVEKQLGKDFYNVRWEMLLRSGLSPDAMLNFVKDIPNLKLMKDMQYTPETFFIKIDGYGANASWGQDMVDIADYASTLLLYGTDFDTVIKEIARLERQVDLKYARKDFGKVKDSGVLRCRKNGYFYDSTREDVGAITSSTGRYASYESKFRRHYEPNELKNPYPNDIDLTRVVSEAEYPLEAQEYNPNKPNHHYKYDENGNVKYYEIVPAMIHPNGKFASKALDLVNGKQQEILNLYKDKELTAKDLDDINERIGEIHWILSHSMPWGRGSASISDLYVKSLYKSLGIKVSGPAKGISWDLEAFCTELSDYKKNYKKLFETEPEIIN